MKDRIVKFIEEEQLTAAEFADRIGVQRSSVSHVLNGRNNPSFSFIQKILENYPRLNPRWLMTGQGGIYEEKTPLNVKTKPVDQNLFSTNEVAPGFNQHKEQIINNDTRNVVQKEINTPHTQPEVIENKSTKVVSRVLIFYDDQTFDDFRPAK